MQKYFKKIIVVLLLIPPALYSQEQKTSIAVSEFKNSTGIYSNESLCSTIPEMLKTELAQLGELFIVERSKLDVTLGEQALSQSGAIDTVNKPQTGKLKSAEFIITGELSYVGDRLRIDTHIIRVESGEIFAEKITGPDEVALESMVRMLAGNINYNLVGKGHHKTHEKIRNYHPKIIIGTAIGAGIIGIAFQDAFNKNSEKYEKATRIDEFDKYYDDSNNSKIGRNVGLSISGALLTTGIVLWLYQKSGPNTLLAYNNSTLYALSPCYFYESQAFGVRLVLKK